MKKPSVTQLIDLLNKPALLNWANKIGLEGICLNDYREKKRKEGTALHKQINEYITKSIPFENKELEENYFKFIEGKEIILSESKIETNYYTGICDVVYNENGVKVLADFKSNQNYIYLDNILQLIAYNKVINADMLCVISIPTFKILEIQIKNIEPYEKIINALISINYYKQQLNLT